MGYDHAEQKEIDPCDSGPSEGSSSSNDGMDPEKQGWNHAYRRGTVVGDAAKMGTAWSSRKTHTHTLGKLKMRASDDDLPTDWWFASTAVPLVAATFAPMANLLSIAALVVFWRNNETTDVALQRFATSTGYPDPGWCYDLNVASLICGFVGNLFLLFNFTKRVRYIVALPATIILFILASGILIGITVAMEIYVPPGKGQVYSQGYWNAVIAACLYAFNAGILMINMVGYFLGHYPQHFTLTDEQRNLILQTMMFFIWLGGGAAVFARTQGWSYPDALYFCDVTVLTIGFGDIVADNDVGRGLIFPFSVGGTVILGLMVSSIHKFAGELSKDKVLRKHVESRRVNTLSRAVTAEETTRSELISSGSSLTIIGPAYLVLCQTQRFRLISTRQLPGIGKFSSRRQWKSILRVMKTCLHQVNSWARLLVRTGCAIQCESSPPRSGSDQSHYQDDNENTESSDHARRERSL